MSVQFDGQSLFDSGPHRLVIGRMGRFVAPPFPQGGGPAFSIDYGVRERTLEVVGRLTASSVGVLFQRFNAIRDLAEASTVGTVSWLGQSWTGMRMIDVQTTGPIDRGRVVSLGYTVRWLKTIA